MIRVHIVSDDGKLYEVLNEFEGYQECKSNIQLTDERSLNDISNRDSIVILDKQDYEMDLLRLIVKRMYVLVVTEDRDLDVELGEESKVLLASKPYNENQIFLALKMMIKGYQADKTLDKKKDNDVDVRKAAGVDYLTGLPNRRGLYEYFSIDLQSEKVHCMFLDIDNFKKVNDTYGHKMGDKLLIKVGHMIKEKVGDGFFARLSGDEFAAILEGSKSREEIVHIAQNIQDSVKELQMGVDISSIISFSIGIMFDQYKSEDLDDILLRCDEAMYVAKKSGKGKYIIYNEIEDSVIYRMSVNKEKTNALNLGQFTILMQPVVNMVTSNIEGVEAGIYWDHPKDGIRLPEEYIDILEEDEFIVSLETRMFVELCRHISKWNGTVLEALRVHFRISKKHLFNKKSLDEFIRVTGLYNINPERIVLSLSEIESHPRVVEAIQRLKRAGFSISCKKGVAGNQASLVSVEDHLADVWVLDKHLISEVGRNRTYTILAKGVVSLAHELNISVAASGVSDDNEVSYLTSYGCEQATGDMFGMPMEPYEFYEFGLSNINHNRNEYIYLFDRNLKDQNGRNEGRFIADGCRYVYDSELEKMVLEMPGEYTLVLENTVELPVSLIGKKDFSVSVSIKAEEMKLWTSVFFGEYENGFISLMPYAWDGVVMYRTKDSMYEDEWHDAIGCELNSGEWIYITATYNHTRAESRLYINGVLVACQVEVPSLLGVRRLVLGGDFWQGNFKGRIGHFITKDYVMNQQDVKNEYEKYFANLRK